MNNLYIELNLPGPNEKLMAAIMKCIDEAPLDNTIKRNHEKIQKDDKLNVISRQYEKGNEDVIVLAKEQYSSYFDEEIFPVVGILTNVNPEEKYACWPPHSDRERIFALNWYIAKGGENVSTIFYKQGIDHTPGPGTGKVWLYSEVEVDEEVHFELNKWYALSVRRAHSIENIENQRLMFSLSFYNITFDEFKVKYPQYIKLS